MNGFKIIRVGTTTTQIVCPHGMIDYSPDVKYRIEKKNVFDPTYIHRREAYHEDTFKLRTPLGPSEYQALYQKLNDEGSYYLVYESAGELRQYPIVVDKLPECPDDLNEYPEQISFSVISRYISYTAPITPNVLEMTEFDESLTITGE